MPESWEWISAKLQELITSQHELGAKLSAMRLELDDKLVLFEKKAKRIEQANRKAEARESECVDCPPEDSIVAVGSAQDRRDELWKKAIASQQVRP